MKGPKSGCGAPSPGKAARLATLLSAVLLATALTVAPPSASAFADEPDGIGEVIAPPAALGVDPFHSKYTSAHGFPIVASSRA